jgi:hypothetical protein
LGAVFVSVHSPLSLRDIPPQRGWLWDI